MGIDFWTLLQLNDATFPIGSYTLSWGGETFVQQGVVFDAASAENFLRSEIEAAFLTNELLPARLSYEAWKKGDYAALKRIDQIYEASKSAKEIREGSKKLAARFLKTVGSWEEGEKALQNQNCGRDKNALQDQDCRALCVRHFPLAYGAYCAKAGIKEDEALSAFLYSQASSRATTIVKLVPLSQTDGQKILHGLFDGFGRVLKKVMEMDESDLCRSCPSGEARAMQHEFLYTRLYMS
ncbi:MAG: urease accessory protein UreF [Treponema sp.]|nr:urease accessory protein UreF [Treponema sp.]